MKRLMAVILALLVMIAPVTAFGACSHQSTAVKYVKATVEKNGSKKTLCKSCGTTVKKTTILKIGEVKANTVAYNGKYRKPAVKVYNSKGSLIDPANYTVTYKKTKSIGTHYATVTFQGKKYKGEVKVPYVIRPAKTYIVGDAGKDDTTGVISFIWGESQGAEGYEIKVSKTKDFEDSRVETVTGESFDMTGLSAARNYYYKIRAFKEVKGKKYYSLWSTVGRTSASGQSEGADNATVLNSSLEIFSSFADGKKDENILVSPVSVLMALGMVENGAHGDTLAQMEEALGVDANEIAVWAEDYINSADEHLMLANAVWFKESKDFDINEVYKERIASAFKGEVNMASFDQSTVDEINGWCDKKTNGLIKKLVDTLSAETRAVLVNATYFKADWLEKYTDGAVSEDEKFTACDGSEQKATMLCSSGKDVYYSDEYACGFKKPYNGGYYFLAILPDKGVDVMDYAEGLDAETFKAFLGNEKKAVLSTKIPEFSYEYDEKSAIEALTSMGIEDVFNPDKADLSLMGKVDTNLFISKIIHKTRIKLDRNGTEAAAVTGVVIEKATAMPDQEQLENKEIFLDRPFIYAICDSKTDIPVFIGVVNKVK